MIEEFQSKFKEKALIILCNWLSTNSGDIKAYCIESDLIDTTIVLLEKKYKQIWHSILKLLYLLSNEKKAQDKLKLAKPLNKLNDILETEEDVLIQEMVISLLCELAFDDEFSIEIRTKCSSEIARIFMNNISKINKQIKLKYVEVFIRAQTPQKVSESGITCRCSAYASSGYSTPLIKIELPWECFSLTIYSGSSWI